ncbi:transposase [Cryobacterium sp. TMT2-15-1]|uniref:transposase n=1 Tax=Cryobacterium sp. TMT2-15-1 TaxID=1259246 RepID=UPI00141BBC12|nr:transposase [Cryobacterium sp. TMT2-15-1]
MDISELPERVSKYQRYSPNERLAILARWDALLEHGQRSAFCRELGIRPSTVNVWDKQRREGLLIVSDARKNKYVMSKKERTDYRRLQDENERLKAQLDQSEAAVEVLGKASELLAALAKSSQIKAPSLPEQVSIPPAFQSRRRDE